MRATGDAQGPPVRVTLTAAHDLVGFTVGGRELEGLRRRHVHPPPRELDDGQLVSSDQAGSKIRLCVSCPRCSGCACRLSLLEFLKGKRITVASDRPFVIYADGDPIGATPATIGVESRCLRVIVPV